MTEKIELNLGMQRFHTRKETRRFMDMINFYRDIWKHRSHLLALLAALTSRKRRWKWCDMCEKAFEDANTMIAKDAMLSYPIFSEDFIMNADDSPIKLGGTTTQKKTISLL